LDQISGAANPAQSIGRTREKPIAANDDGLLVPSSWGDKTAIELFLAGIRGWEAELRRRMGDGKPKTD
jgi:hypothetical protein